MITALRVINLMLQTSAQKSATLVGFGCFAVMFLILCLDKSNYSKKQKPILWAFFGLFMGVFLLLYFFVVK